MDYWEKMRKCFGTERFIITGAAGAILKDKEILLVKNKRLNKWQIPGGVQEIGESIDETIERGIKEELNITLKTEKLIGLYTGIQWNIDYSDGGKLQQVTFFFLMCGKIGEMKNAPKKIEKK